MTDIIFVDGDKYRFDLNLEQSKDNGKIVFYSPTLDLAGIGTTEAKALKDLKAILEITFEYAIKNNTLEKLLKPELWKQLHSN
jgi:predicted RNase H-like HicB family nuclease